MGRRTVHDLDVDVCNSISRAAQAILDGICTRMDVADDIKVYRTTGVIRVDFKIHEEKL